MAGSHPLRHVTAITFQPISLENAIDSDAARRHHYCPRSKGAVGCEHVSEWRSVCDGRRQKLAGEIQNLGI
jgi:hypothetical protein